ncbi:MAG TPA: PHP domain-containing protein [Candidatus Nanoarchaeia archaeon]|nr:PHP domain-containing protein [Candidatus Nanoarchaeia archaeon]
MQIVNSPNEDYHVHSLNFSDGMDTIDGIVRFAGEIGLTRIAITDHSQATLDYHHLAKKTFRGLVKRWKNPYDNGVEVIFGVEADLLNEQGDICDHIHDVASDWLILSAHRITYAGDPARVTEGYIKAMERFGSRIKLIGHPCSKRDFAEMVDIRKLAEAAKERSIPLEVNGANLVNRITDLGLLDLMLRSANTVVVNSDAHTNYELKHNQDLARNYLKEKGYIR